MTKIIDMYVENDKTFAEKANKVITEHFQKMPKSKSNNDPQRLGTRSTFTSRLRMALLDKVGPVEVDLPAASKAQDIQKTAFGPFNKMTIKEQLHFQALSRFRNVNKWVHNLEIMPKNLENLCLSKVDKQDLFEHREQVDTAKLHEVMQKVDCAKLLKNLCPALSSLTAKRQDIAAALLLVTGRRTIEILKTGDFHLPKDATSNDYVAIFSGQAKASLDSTPYEIPLLAPYHLVKAALEKIREMYSAEDMTTAEVNAAFSVTLNNTTKKKTGLSPHELRAVYAMTTYQLEEEKPSLIGWISTVLGQRKPTNALYYQRVKVIHAARWTGGPAMEVHASSDDEEEDQTDDDWVVDGKVEKGRLVGIKEMMEKRIAITASSIRTHTGGVMAVAARIIANNKAKIEEYNASLTPEERKKGQ